MRNHKAHVVLLDSNNIEQLGLYFILLSKFYLKCALHNCFLERYQKHIDVLNNFSNVYNNYLHLEQST